MKKVLKVLTFAVMFCLCAGGMVFSQSLSFSGTISGGIGVAVGDGNYGDNALATDDAPAVKAESPRLLGIDNFSGSSGLALTASLDNDEKTAGLSTNLSVYPDLYSGNAYPVMLWAYGYTKLWDELVTLKGGMVNDATFLNPGDLIQNGVDDGMGALVIVKPHSTLKLGAGAYLGILNGDEKIHTLNILKQGVDADKGLYTVGLAFSLPKFFDLTATYRFPYYDNGSINWEQLTAGVKVTAIENLTLALETWFTGSLADDKRVFDNLNAMYALTSAYTRNDLKIGLNSAVKTKDGSDDPYAGFQLYGAYTIDKLVPRADVYFGLGGTGAQNYFWKNYYLQGVTYNSGDKFIGFRPSVKYNVTSLMSVEGGILVYGRMPAETDLTFDGQAYLSFVYIF